MLKSSINKKTLKTNSYESKVINSLRKLRDTQKELKKFLKSNIEAHKKPKIFEEYSSDKISNRLQIK